MDDIVDDEVAAIDAIDSTHLQSKETGYSLKPGSSSMLDFGEMVIPGDANDHESSPLLLTDILDVKNKERIGASEHACTSPRCIDDPGIMVEELTLRNYNSGNLPVIAASSLKERQQKQQNQGKQQNHWHPVYQRAGRVGSGNLFGDGSYRDNSGSMPSVWDDVGSTFFPEFLDKKPPNERHNEGMDHLQSNENKPLSSNTLLSSGGIRTKILSKSGFSEYFVKNTLKGKGVICRGPAHDILGADIRSQFYPKADGIDTVGSDAAFHYSRETTIHQSHGVSEPRSSPQHDSIHDGISLREWLIAGRNKVNKVESLYIFRQILDLVDISHSQGVALQDIRPSCFKFLPSNQVMYLGSPVEKEFIKNVGDQEIYHSKKRKIGDIGSLLKRWPQFPVRSGIKSGTASDINVVIGCPQDSTNRFIEESPKREHMAQSMSSIPHASSTSKMPSTCVGGPSEEKWYTNPEELRGRCCTLSSNIYSLGILLFELLGSFDSGRAHAVAMLDLRHRILPPSFLSEHPKEAGFCLWLLHPDPSSRPTTREIIQSEVMTGVQELSRDELSPSFNQEDAESELLLHFLTSLKEQKQKGATKLVEDIGCLESDIEEIEMRRSKILPVLSCLKEKSIDVTRNILIHEDHPNLEVNCKSSSVSYLSESRLMKSISQLESAYFSVRYDIGLSDNDMATSGKHDVLRSRENYCGTHRVEEEQKPSDRLGVFFNGLCKYARYSKFEVRGSLRNGDFNSSANVICSLGFDRDEDYFATAGVSKKIKIYDFHALLNDSVDIHYPAVEMSNKSKLSCICWNSYIRNYLASTDYDGVVKLWDAGSGQAISHHIEHNARAWSVDFSRVDPTKLASGSDDCSVKLWSINEKNSLSTIKNIANVCCVQFSPFSTHLLSFGSADYKTYCYDLRNVSTPLCVLAGHDKAVSYVKFLDSETLVSASTDNTLKLWDLNKASSGSLSTNGCILTFRGHTNEKNFVGLSVADGYIVCGSETNEVFSYYRSLPIPITSHKFGSIDPISGKEIDDNSQFVSSVCWRPKSDMVIAANSSGCLKLLQMV